MDDSRRIYIRQGLDQFDAYLTDIAPIVGRFYNSLKQSKVPAPLAQSLTEYVLAVLVGSEEE